MIAIRLAMLVSAGLAACLGAEFLLPGEAPPDQPPVPVTHRQKPAETTPDLDSWQDTALERPLFSRTRTPSPPEAGTQEAAAATEIPRLTGVIITNSSRDALFVTASGQRSVAKEGDKIAQATIVSIESGAVTLELPDGQRVLKPSFSPVAAAGDAAGAVKKP